MNCATAFRFLILVIPTVWVVFRLLPAEHPRYGNLRDVAQNRESNSTADESRGQPGVEHEKDRAVPSYHSQLIFQGLISLAVLHDAKVVVNKFSSTLITRRCTWTI